MGANRRDWGCPAPTTSQPFIRVQEDQGRHGGGGAPDPKKPRFLQSGAKGAGGSMVCYDLFAFAQDHHRRQSHQAHQYDGGGFGDGVSTNGHTQ